MIKAVVYDLDGMVLTAPRLYTEELELKYGIPIRESLFSSDRRYLDCKKGKITLDEFLKPYYKKWKKYPKVDLSFEDAKKDWFDFSRINSEVVEIAKKLKRKEMINLILTNNTRERIDYLDKKYNLSETFEIIGSYDLGVLKPDPAFYKVLEEKYNLKPEEVLIFDDKEENIEELKKFGFKAEIYHSIDDFKKILGEHRLI